MRSQQRWLIALGVAAVGGGLGLFLPGLIPWAEYAVQSARAAVVAQSLASTEDLSAAFEHVAEVIRPSVVNINAVKRIKMSSGGQHVPAPFFNAPSRGFFGDEFFERFFRPRDPGRGHVQQGLGTGVIVGDEGYILTNNHVVDDADVVTVKLSDERTYKAKVVGVDPKTDLAVIKIDADGLHAAKLGDSDELRVGEWVVAAGSPFGLSATITTGIVSAKGRANVGISDYEDFIQTDAAINPGNSGGPLVNLRGEVVGINTAIFSKSGGYMGIGFAIPSNMVKSVMKSLIDEGRVVRGWLGVAIQNLNEGLARSFGCEGTDGVLVGDVTPDSPAAEAGLRSGDIITQFAGEAVRNVERLRSRVAETKPGTTVALHVFRDGKEERLHVTIVEMETQVATGGPITSTADLGMTIQTLTPEITSRLDPNSDIQGFVIAGVVVTGVEPLGPADRAGIRVRDVIVSVEGQAVESVAQFRSALKQHDLRKGVRLGMRFGAHRRFVFVQVEE